MWWAYGDVHSYAGKSLSRYALTRSAVGFGLERLPGQRRGPQNPQKTKPTSPQGVARDSGPITVDRWVPRLHPLMVSPGLWMELSAVGRGGTPPIAWRASADASGLCWSRHFLRNPAFLPPSFRKTPGRQRICAGQQHPTPERVRVVIFPLRDITHSFNHLRTGAARRSSSPRATLWCRPGRRFRRTDTSTGPALRLGEHLGLRGSRPIRPRWRPGAA